MPEQHTPVLIAGGGTVGLSAALFLAQQGVPALVVERRAGISIHPRALGVGPWSRRWPLITPALFSHRTPPDREKREQLARSSSEKAQNWPG